MPPKSPPSVAGLAELSAMAHVSKSTAAGWLRRGAPRGLPDLPPHTDLASGPVWDRSALSAWAGAYRNRNASEPPTPGCSDCADLGHRCWR